MSRLRDAHRSGIHTTGDQHNSLGDPGGDSIGDTERRDRGQLTVHQRRHHNRGRRRGARGKPEQLVESDRVDAVAWPSERLPLGAILGGQQVYTRQGLTRSLAPDAGQRRHFRRRPQRTLDYRITQVIAVRPVKLRRRAGSAYRGLGRHAGGISPDGRLAQQDINGIARMSSGNTYAGQRGDGGERVGALGHTDRR